MPGPKTNEREGTRAVLRWAGISAFKAREVLDLVRGRPVHEASDVLRFAQRDCAVLIEKLLHSAVANAQNNDALDPDELYVSACFADEGPTAKRWRPRARGRATRIRKRSCHITVIVSRMPEDQLARLQARRRAENLAMRGRRVEATRRARAEVAEGATRRERRHPEAFAAEEAGAAEAEGAEPEVPAAAPEGAGTSAAAAQAGEDVPEEEAGAADAVVVAEVEEPEAAEPAGGPEDEQEDGKES
jgi:large subunit ribosomal protein L22